MSELSGPLTINLEKDQLLFLQGENEYDLNYLHSGKLLVFVSQGRKITPIATIDSGQYIGELSFFDGSPRSASIIALEPSTLIQIPSSEIERQFPDWLRTICVSLTQKIRDLDDLINEKGIRKQNVKTVSALSIDEQRKIYEILEAHPK